MVLVDGAIVFTYTWIGAYCWYNPYRLCRLTTW